MHDVTFKPLTTAKELSQLHRLNHAVFAEELGQYSVREDGELTDRFHRGNTYFVAKRNEELVGMISINHSAPFSIEKRLRDGAEVLNSFARASEVRLLAIDGRMRQSIVVAGLFWQVYAEARRRGRSHLLISGIEDRVEMYRSLGFRELGRAVPAGAVSYIPMVMELNDHAVMKKAERFSSWWRRRDREPISLLPGPVQISKSVRSAFERTPLSHRASCMLDAYEDVRRMSGVLVGGLPVALMTGSGTLANDVVGSCLHGRFEQAPGLVLANGEFGERLRKQAKLAGLRFRALQWDWGKSWNFVAIEREISRGAAWVWCVHLETSTGQINDLQRLSRMCEEHGVALAADCVSSLGAVSLEECKVALASGVSGKALGSYAGLAMVFASEATLRETRFDRMPATFDIAENIRQRAPMFTIASPQLCALREALEENYRDAESRARRYAHYCALGNWVRASLRRSGCRVLVDDETAAPVICTFALEDAEIAHRCSEAGFRIAHESEYLAQRGWGQISVMGDLTQQLIEDVFGVLSRSRSTATTAFL